MKIVSFFKGRKRFFYFSIHSDAYGRFNGIIDQKNRFKRHNNSFSTTPVNNDRWNRQRVWIFTFISNECSREEVFLLFNIMQLYDKYSLNFIMSGFSAVLYITNSWTKIRRKKMKLIILIIYIIIYCHVLI